MSQPFVNSGPDMSYHVPKGTKKSMSSASGRVDQGQLIDEVNKLMGYRDVAAVQDSDPIRLNFQTFSGLRNFVRLEFERDLDNLEEQLERLDKSEATKCNERRLGSKNVDEMGPRSSRHELLAKIQEILVEYDELRLRSERIQALATPTEQDSNDAYNVFYTAQSMDHAEQERLFQTDDLATLSGDAGRGWKYEVHVSILGHVCSNLFLIC